MLCPWYHGTVNPQQNNLRPIILLYEQDLYDRAIKRNVNGALVEEKISSTPFSVWLLNLSLLKTKAYNKLNTSRLAVFFTLNNSDHISNDTLQASSKANIRRISLKLAADNKKQAQFPVQQIRDLEA